MYAKDFLDRQLESVLRDLADAINDRINEERSLVFLEKALQDLEEESNVELSDDELNRLLQEELQSTLEFYRTRRKLKLQHIDILVETIEHKERLFEIVRKELDGLS